MTATAAAAQQVQPEAKPPLKGGVVPYLMLADAARVAEFYKRALGAEEPGDRATMDDGRILNCQLYINDGSLMLMDPMPEYGYPAVAPQAFNLHLQVADADAWFDRAVEAGCRVLMPMRLEFWGDRYGMVQDPFGVTWAFGSTPRG